ncbi:hypothetical protein [Nocardia grenadensis]|uniref:hypothetical protein n=1 Tax=Nocardia grenadensis TaxID=931537 RepID=UPI001FE16A03|nr:hypothetical protein [Nocardia grenadensis]
MDSTSQDCALAEILAWPIPFRRRHVDLDIELGIRFFENDATSPEYTSNPRSSRSVDSCVGPASERRPTTAGGGSRTNPASGISRTAARSTSSTADTLALAHLDPSERSALDTDAAREMILREVAVLPCGCNPLAKHLAIHMWNFHISKPEPLELTSFREDRVLAYDGGARR